MIDPDGSEVSLQEYQRRIAAGEFCTNCQRWGTVDWFKDSLARMCFLHTDWMTGPFFTCGQFQRSAQQARATDVTSCESPA